MAIEAAVYLYHLRWLNQWRDLGAGLPNKKIVENWKSYHPDIFRCFNTQHNAMHNSKYEETNCQYCQYTYFNMENVFILKQYFGSYLS